MMVLGRFLAILLQLGFVFALFKFGITGKQTEGRPLNWFYRILSLTLGSFILVGGILFAIIEHQVWSVLFQAAWIFIKNSWTEVL
jgi:hypothetical protein